MESSVASAATQSLVQGGFDTLLPQVSHVCNTVERLDRFLRINNSWQEPNAAVYSTTLRKSQAPWDSPPARSVGRLTSHWVANMSRETPFGSLRIIRTSYTNRYRKKHERKDAEGSQMENKFYFRFQPYGWVSRYVIELQIKWFQSNGSIIHIGLTPACRRMCMDVDVIRSLDMKVCRACITMTRDPCTCNEEKYPPPDPEAVRKSLEFGHLRGNDLFHCQRWIRRWGHWTPSILEVSFCFAGAPLSSLPQNSM